MKRVYALLTFIIVITSGFLLGYASKHTPSVNEANTQPTNYPLLAQRIFVENPNDTKINFSGLRTQLRSYFVENDIDGGLYFEYLPTGTSIRVNGNQEFRAASLMKLPVAMEVYRAEELGLLDLDSEVVLQEEWLQDGFGSLYEKGAGHTLSLREIVQILLTDSDNTALRAAIAATDNVLQLEDRALGSLDVEFTVDDSGSIDISSRAYASFLKCLYFSCYNNVAHSNELLTYLSETTFSDRIVAGVPENVNIAHKIGVFNTQVQSDCGIVYVEKNPYILCIMLQKEDSPSTNQIFTELSKLTYDFILRNAN